MSTNVELQYADWRDYYELTKPKVVMLIVFTAVVGMFLAVPGWPGISALLFGTLGIGLAASSAAVFNHVLDARIDIHMLRTQARPLPQGRLSERAALRFASVLCVISMIMLWFFVNPLTALLTFFSLIGYAGIYTVWLKRATPQNIVIGGAAGAAPPALGWVAVTGELHSDALLLFLIIFAWTPPHFWALAIARKDEYAKVGIPMLPVTHGHDHAVPDGHERAHLPINRAGHRCPLPVAGLGDVYEAREQGPAHADVQVLDYLPHGPVRGVPRRSLPDHPG